MSSFVDLLDDRLHLFVLARTAAEENQLPLDELILLPRQRGDVLGLRDAIFAMTAGAQFGLFLAGGDRIGRVSREISRRDSPNARNPNRTDNTKNGGA